MPKLISELHRLRRLSSASPFPLFICRSIHYRCPNPLFSLINLYPKSEENPQSQPRFDSKFTSLRPFSIHPPINNSENEAPVFDKDSNSHSDSELLDDPHFRFDGGSEVAEVVASSNEWYDPFIRTVISVLDGYHDLTGIPWWIIIASSTLVLRLAILPLLVLQLKKLKRFSELMPQLPPPFPPPLSGKSYIKQYLLFRKEKEAIGCPSALWGLATISVQVPCFVLLMASIRQMSMDHHPGFDCGGMLWFQNLTEAPHGVFSPIFPILIAGLHFTNVQISFRMAKDGKVTGMLSLLAKLYKHYLDILTIPLCVVAFYIPQGSLVYWLTNSSLTLIQQLSLHHPFIRENLGLPDLNAMKSEGNKKFITPETRFLGPEMDHKISAHNFSPDELVPLSVGLLAKGEKDRAILLLRLALKKDPEYVRAMVLLGMALLQQKKLTEASECLERAVSKLLHVGHPTKDEDVNLLINASNWAGISSFRQGKTAAGLEHLQRVAKMKEPEDPRGKAHYFETLVSLGSALYAEGRKDEAATHLRRAAAYNYDAYNEYLQQCLDDSNSDNITSDQNK